MLIFFLIFVTDIFPPVLLHARMDPLLNILSGIAPLTEVEKEQLMDCFRMQELKKGDFWMQEGKRASLLAFVQKGYLRKYYNQQGKDITDFFYLDHSFIGDLPGILSGRPSVSNVVAMEDSTLLTIPFQKLDQLCTQYHSIEHIVRVLVQQSFLTFYERSVSFIVSTPKERYYALVEAYPQIFQRVTQYHIASYLGITPQHLSRLRSSR